MQEFGKPSFAFCLVFPFFDAFKLSRLPYGGHSDLITFRPIDVFGKLSFIYTGKSLFCRKPNAKSFQMRLLEYRRKKDRALTVNTQLAHYAMIQKNSTSNAQQSSWVPGVLKALLSPVSEFFLKIMHGKI